MAQLGRPGMTTGQKSEVWQRWHNGESLSDIGRAVGKHPGSVFGILKLHGGIVPSERHRSRLALTLDEREEISRGIASSMTIRQIAGRLNRSPSTVSREIARNGGRQRYRATLAEDKAWDSARRPKLCRLVKANLSRRRVNARVP